MQLYAGLPPSNVHIRTNHRRADHIIRTVSWNCIKSGQRSWWSWSKARQILIIFWAMKSVGLEIYPWGTRKYISTISCTFYLSIIPSINLSMRGNFFMITVYLSPTIIFYRGRFKLRLNRRFRNSSSSILIDLHFRQSTCILYRSDLVLGWLDLLGKYQMLDEYFFQILEREI